MRNIQVQTEPAATTLWTLRKSGTDIICVFDARGGVFELRIARDGVVCATHRFEAEAEAAKFAADLETDLKAHKWAATDSSR